MKTDILEIHKNCLHFLLEWQMNHEKFYFVPRKINNKNRLEQGMYFRGNDEYMVLTFWDNADSKEFIYNINWCCDVDGVSSIELSCRDDDQVLPYVIVVKDIIESTGKKFKETKKNREQQSSLHKSFDNTKNENEVHQIDAPRSYISYIRCIIQTSY